MDNGKIVVNACPVRIPAFCLSPEDTSSGTETESLRPYPVTFATCENGTNSTMPSSSLDHQPFVLPPTPDGSLSVGSAHDEAFLYEDISGSSVPGIIPADTNIGHCPADVGVTLPVGAYLLPHFDKMSSYSCSEIKQSNELTVVRLSNFNFQSQTLLPNQNTEAVRFSETDLHRESANDDQNESRNDKSENEGLKQTDSASIVTLATESLDEPDNIVSSNPKLKRNSSNSLKFPPCVICSGKASGSHYGAITCEACKGFFRRYLQKKKEFKCTKEGKCEIVCSKKGNCSGCRLKKCLALGMSKEMTKLGRYTLTKRTELIIDMKKVEGKVGNDSVTEENYTLPDEAGIDANSCNLETDYIMRHLLQNTKTLNLSKGFNNMLVAELVQALDDLEPYGPNVKTKEQISQMHRHHSERYKLKTDLFGKMNSVPRDEYNKLYKEFGIDIDGRMADMKIECEDAEGDIARYCSFAKHIPGFYSLPVQDQSNLLKASMTEFFTIVYIDSYNGELQTFISKNGHGYHFDEVADREFSAKLLTLTRDVCCRLQMMELSKEETALIAALTLLSTDRCKLQNPALVEKLQLAVTELLQQQIKKEKKQAARGRFTKIIESLTHMREMSELYTKENSILWKDEVIVEEFPFVVGFMFDEN